ncbi:MAG: hypothetical protein HeimC3_23840 [Candidatus Heimdallarchaeota archaeon LC_3]|nr:MAG: hypothetical protein HeimC3_23840 [Candidatus Heimdallarchaeota archaeon LC_3]
MKLGKILENLVKRKMKYYNLTYEQHHEKFFENLKNIPNLNELKISPILLVTDLQPNSLVSIAYTIRLARLLGKETKLYSLTEGKHTNTINKEFEELDIRLEKIIELEVANIEDIAKVVDKYGIRLIIVSYAHHLWESIINQIPATVLVTSLKNIHK